MSVPSSGGSRKFQFKTAPEGQGSLECVHQELDHSKHHQVGPGDMGVPTLEKQSLCGALDSKHMSVGLSLYVSSL